jgi:hypothetical protein
MLAIPRGSVHGRRLAGAQPAPKAPRCQSRRVRPAHCGLYLQELDEVDRLSKRRQRAHGKLGREYKHLSQLREFFACL